MKKLNLFTLSNIIMCIAIGVLCYNSYLRYVSNSTYQEILKVRKDRLKIEKEFKEAVTDLDTSMTNWMKRTSKFNDDRKEFLIHIKKCKDGPRSNS